MLEHGVEEDEQLAHASCEGHLLRLTRGQQPLVEVPDDRVVAAGHQRTHVESGADPGASSPYGTFAPQRAAVPVEGSHSHEGSGLSSIQGAQLWQVRQKAQIHRLTGEMGCDGVENVLVARALI